MAPPSLPQPLDRLTADRLPGEHPLPIPLPLPLPAAERAQRPSPAAITPVPPGGELPGRLPGPHGPDRPLASGAEPPRPAGAFDLPATAAAVAAARRVVRALLSSWGVGEDVLDNAVLVTSELVTNALVHSPGERITCRLHGGTDRVRIEVEDQNRGPTLPVPRRSGPDDQNGRGLFLVDALSSDWGVTVVPGRPARVVWAELPHTSEGSLPHGPTPTDP
ncbi:ATP-binding protein [Streptomyces sp. NPDC006739]|uniref:ATP-binding protein n=1 Tax=Streptomyces sp. NPDC006739 TaxID=3364763 RepID=UPI0036889A3F